MLSGEGVIGDNRTGMNKTLILAIAVCCWIGAPSVEGAVQRRKKDKTPPPVGCDLAACQTIQLSGAEVKQGQLLTAMIFFSDPEGRSAWTYSWTLNGEALDMTAATIELPTSQLAPGEYRLGAQAAHPDTPARQCPDVTFRVIPAE